MHFLRHLRPLFPAALAVLVVVANAHCAASAADALHKMVQVHSPAQPRPLQLPGGCENESGCICRGATLVQSMDVSDFAPRATEMIVLDAGHESLDVIMLLDAAPPASDPVFFRSPPLSGRILRAHLASFLN